MAETALVAEKVDAGEWLIRAADKKGVPVRAAFWIFETAEDRWRLALEADPLRPIGLRDFARALHDAVAEIPAERKREAARELLLTDVSLYTQPYPPAKILRTSLGKAASVLRTKLSNAVLYRLEPSQTL